MIINWAERIVICVLLLIASSDGGWFPWINFVSMILAIAMSLFAINRYERGKTVAKYRLG